MASSGFFRRRVARNLGVNGGRSSNPSLWFRQFVEQIERFQCWSLLWTLRYDDSSTTNGLFIEVLWEITRDKAEGDRHEVEALHHEDFV